VARVAANRRQARHHSLPWTNRELAARRPRGAEHAAAQVTKFELPLTMTFAVVPSLRLQPEVAAEWLPRILSNEYDPVSFLPHRNAVFCLVWR